MPRKKKEIKVHDRIVMDAAVGLCAWGLVVETLIMLERRDVLRNKDTLRIIAGAVAAIEALAAETLWHPSFPVAIEMLREQVARWRLNKDPK